MAPGQAEVAGKGAAGHSGTRHETRPASVQDLLRKIAIPPVRDHILPAGSPARLRGVRVLPQEEQRVSGYLL